MKILDKIDEVTFNVLDDAMLWVWNRWGLSWQNTATFCMVMSVFVGFGAWSNWGKHYGTVFWIFGPIFSIAALLVVHLIHRFPVEVHNRIALSDRCSFLNRLFRLMQCVFCISSLIAFKFGDSAVSFTWLASCLILDTLAPTEPRNKKRKEVLHVVTNFS